MATSINKQTSNRMLRVKELVTITGLSKTTLWRLEKVGDFPARKKLSVGAVGWSLLEVENWISGRDVIVSGATAKTH